MPPKGARATSEISPGVGLRQRRKMQHGQNRIDQEVSRGQAALRVHPNKRTAEQRQDVKVFRYYGDAEISASREKHPKYKSKK